jgi:hypothetical protein
MRVTVASISNFISVVEYDNNNKSCAATPDGIALQPKSPIGNDNDVLAACTARKY